MLPTPPTTIKLTAAVTFFILLSSTAVVTASNRFNWTPSVALLDGSGEVNGNGFCLRIGRSSRLDCSAIFGSSCLPDALGTQFGYNEDDQTIYAVNITCPGTDDLSNSTQVGNSSTSCLTVEAPISEGSSLFVTECSPELSLLQTFAYTSSGKFLIQDDDNSKWCLGMDDRIWQQGSPSPYEDPTFWRNLSLMDCNSTEYAPITWLVDPTPMDAVEDGPMPGMAAVEVDEDIDDLMMDDILNATMSEMNSNPHPSICKAFKLCCDNDICANNCAERPDCSMWNFPNIVPGNAVDLCEQAFQYTCCRDANGCGDPHFTTTTINATSDISNDIHNVTTSVITSASKKTGNVRRAYLDEGM